MRSFRTVLALLALLLASSCQTTRTGGVTLPPLPTWIPPADTNVLAGYYVRMEAARLFPGVPVHVADEFYTRVSATWLEQYLQWTWEAARVAGYDYVANSEDCEDFAIGLHFFANRAAAKSGVKAAPLLARIVVQWDGTARHELAGVVTDRGILVVEPQPTAAWRTWPVEKYPRRILSITFGDFNP